MTKQDSKHASKAPSSPQSTPSESSPIEDKLPILKFGPKSNLPVFKRILQVKAGKQFGKLARFIETRTYYAPNAPTNPKKDRTFAALPQEDQEDLVVDYTEARKAYNKEIIAMRLERPKLYNMIYEALSVESRDKVQQNAGWAQISAEMDPLELWKIIEDTHLIGGDTPIGPIAGYRATEAFRSLRQGQQESIVSFKRRFDESLS